MNFALELLDGASGRVAVIWLALVVLASVALGALALPTGVRRPRQIVRWLADSAAQRRADRERRATQAHETIRYADEIAVAARGSAATAERRRAECQQAHAEVAHSWSAWQEADARLERARRAAAYAAPERTPSAEEVTERAQALRRTAQAAYRRGDLSDTQLLDALTHRNGWDPARHPVEQELALARASAAHRLTAYQAALEAEEAAWRAADVATAAVRTLRHEATTARALADRAREARPTRGARATIARATEKTAATKRIPRQADPTQAVATQEVRRELPSWAQPTAARPQIAAVR